MAGECIGDDALAALLCDFEPLPDGVFSPGGSSSPSGTASDESGAPVRVEAEKIARANGQTPIMYTARAPSCDGGRRARYRARSRNELMYLREVVKDLEHELERCRRRITAPPQDGRSSELAASTQAVVWRALAARQKLERQQSEEENARLRGLLDSQLRFAAELQHVLHRRASGASVGLTPGPRRVGSSSADARLLEVYLSELDSIRARTDEVLLETGITLRPESPHRFIPKARDATSRRSGDPDAGSYVEFQDTHVIRADLETARYIWPLVIQHYLRRNGATYEPKSPEAGVHAFTYEIPHKWIGRDGSVSIIQSVKTFDERDRQVNVYRVLSVGEGALAGLAIDETGWSVLTRSRSNPSHTICRVVARMTPMRFHRHEPRGPMHTPPQLMEVAKVLFQVCDIDVGKTIAQLEHSDTTAAQYQELEAAVYCVPEVDQF